MHTYYVSRNWGRRSCRFTRPLWKRLGSSKSETEDSFLRSRATRGSFLFSPCKYEQYSHRLGSFSSSSWVPVKRSSSLTVVNYPNKAIYLCQGQEHGCLSLVLFSPLLLCLLFLSFSLPLLSILSLETAFSFSPFFFFFVCRQWIPARRRILGISKGSKSVAHVILAGQRRSR